MLAPRRLATLFGSFTTMAVVAGLLGVIAPSAQAVPVHTWTGAESGSWSDPDNWQGHVPGPGADLVFPPSALRTQVVNDLASGTEVGSITITGAGYDVSGNGLSVVDAVTTTHMTGASSIRADVNLVSAEVDVATGGTLSLEGVVSGAAGLRSGGGGTLVLDGVNTYTGLTAVGPGVLEVNGAISDSVVLAGGTLAGSGTFNGGGLSASAPSTVSPGRIDRAGILTHGVGSALTLPNSSTLHVDLNGPMVEAEYDQIKLTSLSAPFNPNGATLEIDLGYVPVVNTTFQIVSQAYGSPITGRFDGISQFGSLVAGPVTFSVGYFNSGIILTVTAVSVSTWDGGGSTHAWSEPANWRGDVAPRPGYPLVFPSGITQRTAVNDFAAGTSFAGITVAGSGYTLSGNQVVLSSAFKAEYASGRSSFSAPLKLSDRSPVSVQSGGTLALESEVSGTSGLTKSGAGRLLLSAGNTYSGVTSVQAGTLAVSTSSALGSSASQHGTVVSSGASLELRGSINTSEPIAVVGGGDAGVGALHAGQGNNVAQHVSLSGDASLGVAAESFLAISSTLREDTTASHLTKVGPGVLDVMTVASHTGGTTVAAGTLAVEGTLPGATTARSGATIAGAGGSLGSVTSAGATVSAGYSASPFVTTMDSLTLDSASIFLAQLNGTAAGHGSSGHSRLVVRGEASLSGATFSPTVNGYTPTPGDVLTIVSGSQPVRGTFKDLPEGAYVTVPGASGHMFRISYVAGAGNDITLTNVTRSETTLASTPNPSTRGDVTLRATVTPTTATGTVTFSNGVTTLGTATLTGGRATFLTSELGLGTHTLTATYSGTATVAGSTSNPLVQHVHDPAPDTTITSGPTESSTGNPMTATFTFASPDLDVNTFACSLDDSAFSACTSPQTYVDLAGGDHTFEVRAVDAASQTDPTPAARNWHVTGAFVVSGDVSIKGTPKVGQTLTADSSVATSPASVTTTGQWYRGSDVIDGATRSAYTLTNDDVSFPISYRESHARDHYVTAVVSSDPTAAVTGGVIDLGTPTITGAAVVGRVLSATLGPVAPAEASIALEWFVDGAATGVAGALYEIQPSDLGKPIAVTATASLSGYDTVSETSPSTGQVERATFASGPGASVSGVWTVGGTLTALEGAPIPVPDAYAYQWFSDGSPINGATSRLLTLEPGHRGTRISVRVTALRPGYIDSPDTSEPSAPVDAAAFTTGPSAAVSGVLKVGETLTAGEGSPDPTPHSYRYQWWSGGGEIPGATERNFTLRTEDVDQQIRVRVTASRPGHLDAVDTSPASAPVVTDKAPELRLTPSATRMRLGEALILSWTSRNALSLSAAAGWTGARNATGAETMTPARIGSHTYTLSATNDSGTTVAQVSVDVGLPAASFSVTSSGTTKPGRAATVRVRGLAPGEAYTVRIGGVKVAAGKASAAGEVKRQIRVPSSMKSGRRLLKVTGSLGDRTGQRQVNVKKAAALSLTLRAATVRASDKQRIVVRGLHPAEKVAVFYRGKRITPTPARANGQGVYAHSFDVGRSWGRKTVSFRSARAESTATNFVVTPRCPQGIRTCR